MVYKSINGLAPQHMSNLFTRNSTCSSRNLRNTKTDLRLSKKTSANGQKCFSYQGAKLWNSLSAEIKQAPSFAVFKQNIQQTGRIFLRLGGWPRPGVSVLDSLLDRRWRSVLGSPLLVWRGSGAGTGGALAA